jgi:hypothetical protein
MRFSWVVESPEVRLTLQGKLASVTSNGVSHMFENSVIIMSIVRWNKNDGSRTVNDIRYLCEIGLIV